MSLSVAQVGDYYILDFNMVAGTPLAAYVAGTPTGGPAKGHLLVRDTSTGPNVWDFAADTEPPVGFLEQDNRLGGIITLALLVPGVQLILPTSAAGGAIALGDKVVATGAVDSTTGRSVVKKDNTNGVGRVNAINPAGTNTASVVF
ncbi:MAG TPA: hypothetical protein VIM84_14410 [Gemmatimonadales bacterium]